VVEHGDIHGPDRFDHLGTIEQVADRVLGEAAEYAARDR
jgi:hypothetical protein